GLDRLVEQLVNVKLQRDRLLATTPEGNPAFDPINRQIETLKESIKDHISGIKSSLQATRQQLQAFNSNFEASIRDLPVQERQFINIKRQQGIKEELYVYLLKKQEEAALSYASTLSDSRTIDQAFYGSPVSPNATLTFGMALLFGLMVPVGLIYGRQIFNDRIISDKEIKDATSAPLLAELVYYVSSSPLPLRAWNSGIIAEQFRTLRTNLSYLHDRDSGRVTLLTSGMPGEGKSFISCNLGLALASCDRKTVLLELDMRKPGVSKNFSLTSETGLTDYLKGNASMEEITQPSGVHPNLFIIKTGPLPESPADLLGNIRLDNLIDWLRFYFNDILIDTPPIHLVTDAMIASRFSDVTLYIIRQAYTHRSELDYVNELQAKGKLRNLNIIFNGVEMGARYNYKTNFNYRYYTVPDDLKRLGLGSALQGVIKRL
ncbi:MAG TPA: polysaccharide biosynthesis tyrosine autokinase, partial [Sphingobacteriaceae bacterium]